MAIEGTKGPGLTKEQLTAEMKHVSTPERLSTPFGELEFFDGVPKPESVQSIFDGLDLVRGITAFLTTVPGVSLAAMRPGLRTAGVDAPDRIGYTDPKCNSDSVYLTPNTETTYGITFLDLSALGPTVIEVPPQSLCVVDDFWFRYVADMGGCPGSRQGRRRQVPVPAAGLRRRTARRVLHLPESDVLRTSS